MSGRTVRAKAHAPRKNLRGASQKGKGAPGVPSRGRGIAAGVGAMITLLALVMAVALIAQPPLNDPGARESQADGSAVATRPEQLSREQLDNAALIVSIAEAAGADRSAVTITLMTAMQESSLRNTPTGDRDSRGLFQQRPSQNWGTAAQVMDPHHATEAFLGVGDHSANPGLFDIPGWRSMSKNDAAQAVQHSAHPTLYGRWEPLATRLWREFTRS